MDFLIQTAWYSIELHGHAMAFHETASVLQGTPWHSMELYNIPWNSMDLQGNSMEFHGIPWNCITTSWNSVELHGIPWNNMYTPRILRGIPWISMEFHNSMESHGGISHGECADNFSSEPDLWLLRHTDEPQRGRNSCLWLQYRSVLSSFGVVLMSCRVNFYVVRSTLQYSACRI